MPSDREKLKASVDPICYRLAPDRRLLDGRCDVAGCGQRDQDPDVAHDVPPCLMGDQHHTVIRYDGLKRLALMVTPQEGGSVADQAWEAVSTIRAILRQQEESMAVTLQTVFIDKAENVPAVQRLFEAYFGERMPLTLFVVQPPCDRRAVAIEAWAMSTKSAKIDFCSPHLVTVEYAGIRWIYASAGSIGNGDETAYNQSAAAFANLEKALQEAGSTFDEVARIWLYQGGITELEGETERYRELNRARTDFFAHVPFGKRRLMAKSNAYSVYPASTGIGTLGHGLVTICLALQTDREDVQLLPLENPLQVSSFNYPDRYSAKSPKFARAIAVRFGKHVTTWVSGTASIVNSETVHIGDIEKQTEQTLTNIAKLIDRENFARLGWPDVGATLDDLAKIRVYVKRPEDYEACRAVCEKRLGRIPAIYAVAEVCRPDLLVEIEGVAFSPVESPLKSELERSEEAGAVSGPS